MKKALILLLSFFGFLCSAGKIIQRPVHVKPKEKIITNISGKGPEIMLKFFRGSSFYYPLVVIWIEDMEGKYIQTLYVSKSVTTRVFTLAVKEADKWFVAPVRATKSLPYWAHKKDDGASDDIYVLDEKPVVPDAYTGATPKAGFILTTRTDNALPEKFKVMMEINQKWDRNEYWTSNKYPGDEFYKLSCQPALVYEAILENGSSKKYIPMKLIGHSHYSGMTGELFSDLSTFTSALSIADSVTIRINNRK